jgi:hypothetical protein
MQRCLKAICVCDHVQNRDLLFFHESTWGNGLEMEGSYYQKAIQSASKIRKSVQVRYAYYASDNLLKPEAH